jgi:hypothetical protein
MTGDEFDRRIEFLLQQQAKFQESLLRFEQQGEAHRREMREMRADTNFLAVQAEEDRKVIREAFTKIEVDITRLVNIVENTRDFAQQVARLAVATERRVTALEDRQESK